MAPETGNRDPGVRTGFVSDLQVASLFLCLHTLFSLCVSVANVLFHKDTTQIGFRPTMKPSLYLLPSSRMLSLNKATFR